MKKAEVSTGFRHDKISIFDKKVDISFSNTGHYCIEIENGYVDPFDIKYNIIIFSIHLELMSVEKKQSSYKLHR